MVERQVPYPGPSKLAILEMLLETPIYVGQESKSRNTLCTLMVNEFVLGYDLAKTERRSQECPLRH